MNSARRPRVAVVMAGAPRSLPQLIAAQVARLDELRAIADVDVFVHAWRPPEGWTDGISASVRALDPVAVEMDVPWVAPFPVSPAETSTAGEYERRRRESFIGMWAGASRGYELMQAEERRRQRHYDWVIRTRPDVLWAMRDEFEAAAAADRSSMPRIYAALPAPSDVAAVVRRAEAGRYFSVFASLPQIDEALRRKQLKSFVAEYALEAHLFNEGVSWDEFHSPLVIVRTNGDLHWLRADKEYRAYTAARSVMTEHGDNLPWIEDADPLTVERVSADLSTNVFGGVAPPAGLAERVWAVWRGVRAGDPNAMDLAVRLGDGIREVRGSPASLSVVGIAHQAAHLLRTKGVSLPVLAFQGRIRSVRLLLGIARYQVVSRHRLTRWYRLLASPSPRQGPVTW